MNDKKPAEETTALRSILWQPVFDVFKDEVKSFLWFVTPNPLLGGYRPIDMILKGREKKLAKFIQDCREENGTRKGNRRTLAGMLSEQKE